MKPHLLINNSEFSQPAQPLIPLVSFDPKADTLIIDASIAESLFGWQLNNLQEKHSKPDSLPSPDNSNCENQDQLNAEIEKMRSHWKNTRSA